MINQLAKNEAMQIVKNTYVSLVTRGYSRSEAKELTLGQYSHSCYVRDIKAAIKQVESGK